LELDRPFNMIIAGVGGQGSLFASRILAQAAIHQGYSVRVAESYGVTQRGGPVYSQVRIGPRVYGPLIPRGRGQVILGLEPIETLRRCAHYLAPGGGVAVNRRVNEPLESTLGRQPRLEFETIRQEIEKLGVGQLLAVDARAMAEQAGGAATLNVFMVGTLFGLDGFPLSYDSVESAIRAVTPPRFLAGNLLSLTRGQEYALAVKGGLSERQGSGGASTCPPAEQRAAPA
jgi:indolepyruvate ferredoxin oxidoreductase beta subunit